MTHGIGISMGIQRNQEYEITAIWLPTGAENGSPIPSRLGGWDHLIEHDWNILKSPTTYLAYARILRVDLLTHMVATQ